MIKYASAPACDGKMFFIGVTGFDHPTTQDFLFYDSENMQEQEFLAYRQRNTERQEAELWSLVEPDPQKQFKPLAEKKKTDKRLLNNTIYSWDWREESETRNVWLKVDTESGEPIRLPLFNEVAATVRQMDEQLYQMQAFIPLSKLPSEGGTVILPSEKNTVIPIPVYDTDNLRIASANTYSAENEPHSDVPTINLDRESNLTAPIRNGYIYIAYNDKIWREIEVTSEKGQPCFRDINLLAYREGNHRVFKTNTDRKVTGKPLQEIWYPAREYGTKTNVRFAFSEVQWSGARLNFMESRLDEMEKRMIVSPDESVNFKDIPPVRARQPELELQLCEPAMLSLDLSGEILEKVFNEAKQELFNYYFSDKYSPQLHRYEYCARDAVLGEKYRVDDEKKSFPEKVTAYNTPGAWQAEAVPDYFADARKRKLTGIILPDPLYDVRHKTIVLQSCSNYLSQLQLDAAYQPFYNSAYLLQMMVFSPELGGEENPSYKHKELVDQGPHSNFDKTLRINPRKQTRNAMFSLQKKVLALLKDPDFTLSLKDILSLDDTNRYAGYILVNNCINNLLSNPDIADTLLPKHDYSIDNDQVIIEVAEMCLDDSPGSLFEALCGGKQTGQALMRAMYEFKPEQGAHSASMEPQLPKENNGSGILNVDEITWEEISRLEPRELKLPETAILFLNSSQGGSEDLFPQARRMFNVIDSAIGSLFNTALAVQQKNAQVLHDNVKVSSRLDVIERFKKLFNKLYTKAYSMKKFIGRSYMETLHIRPKNMNLANFECDVIGEGIDGKATRADVDVGATKHSDLDPKKQTPHNRFEKNPAGKTSGKGKGGRQFEVVISKEAEAAQMIAAEKRALGQCRNQKKAVNPKKFNHISLPVFFMAIEAINCHYAYSYAINNYKKDTVYALANVFSATLDISLAGVNHINRLCMNTGMLYNISETTIFTFSEATIQRFSLRLISIRLVNQISLMGVLSFISGVVTAGLLAWDAYRLWTRLDYDAAIGCGIMTLGVLGGAIGGLLVQATGAIIGLGPVGLISAVVIIVGFVIFYFYKDKPVETWIKHGPFTREEPTHYAFLRTSPDDAYLQLLSLFFSINIKAGHLPDLSFREHHEKLKVPVFNLLSPKDVLKLKQEQYTHYVHVSSAVAQLLDPGDELQFTICFLEAVQKKTTTTTTMHDFKEVTESHEIDKQTSIVPEHHIVLPQGRGKLYFFKEKYFKFMNSSKTYSMGTAPMIDIEYQHIIWSFAQVRWGDYIFPQPSLDQMEDLIEEKDAVLNSCHMSPVFQDGCKENYYWKISKDQID